METAGTLARWYAGTLARWYAGTLAGRQAAIAEELANSIVSI